MIQYVEKIGRTGMTILITLLSIALTHVISHAIYWSAGKVMSTTGEIASFASPLLIAPVLSWIFIGLLLKVKNLETKMTELATYDALTRLYNRNACFVAIESLLRYVKRTQTDMVLLFIDIDHFKGINDAYGHAVGDAVLRQFAAFLTTHLRENDIIGRIGGEEFLVGLPGLTLENGSKVAEKLAAGVMEHPFEGVEGEAIQVTISIGAVSYHYSDDIHLDTLVKNADRALYSAKKNGRNQVCCYREGEYLTPSKVSMPPTEGDSILDFPH